MTIHTIIYLPDPRLRAPCQPITDFDDPNFHTLIEDMFETMYHARGVGLAAPQIGVSLSLSVIDIAGDKQNQLVLVNPVIIEAQGKTSYQEGCLSIPGVYETVIRATWVKVRAQNRHGEFFEIDSDGVLGECLQHEIDHLNGKLLVDYLSALKRKLARNKLEKFKRGQIK